MAAFAKYKRDAAGRLLLHNNRAGDDGVTHENEEIDSERTHLNYYFKKGVAEDVHKRVSEVYSQNRGNYCCMGEIIVTLPKDVKAQDERAFFRSVYDFYCEDFGKENVINAIVHKDETTPHIHLDFVPIIKGTKGLDLEKSWVKKALKEWEEENGDKEFERLSCRNKINRVYLRGMHQRLSAYVANDLGYHCQILNGATVNGNKTVMELKIETLNKKISEAEAQKASLIQDIERMLETLNRIGLKEKDIGLKPLMDKIDDLEHQNEMFREILSKVHYTFTQDEIEQIKAKRYVPAEYAKVNVFDDKMLHAPIDENAIIVIELYDNIERKLPQQAMINKNPALKRQVDIMLRNASSKVALKQAEGSNQMYLFIKTDNQKQTVNNLLSIESLLRDIDRKRRKIYMEQFESDKYDIARNVLENLNIPSYIYTKHSEAVVDETSDKSIEKQER